MKRVKRRAKRKTIIERLQEERLLGHNEGYDRGLRHGREEYRPALHLAEALKKFVLHLENLKDVDPAITQIFVTNGNTHSQMLLPLRTLLNVACELRRLGYGG